METVGIACDHAGYEMKEVIKVWLKNISMDVKDFGTYSKESVDYPDYIHPLAEEISRGIIKKGIILCGTGIGVSMTANKYNDVRAALCWNEDIVVMARKHNDANILALPARYLDNDDAIKLVKLFFDADFEGGRHARRVEKINR
jgi:ribose 5-phosphate isomerase B